MKDLNAFKDSSRPKYHWFQPRIKTLTVMSPFTNLFLQKDEHHILLLLVKNYQRNLKLKKERLGKNGDGVQTYE